MTLDNTQSAESDPTANFITSGQDKLADAQKSASVKSDETTDESETSENDTEQLDNDETDESSNDDTLNESESKPKKKGGFQKRIDKFRKQLSEKDQALLETRAENLRLKEEALKGKAPDKTQDEKSFETKSEFSEGKPDPNDFDTNADYIDALTDWKLDQKDKKVEAAKRSEQVKSEFEKKQETHNERVSEYTKNNPSYKEDINNFIEEHGDYQFSVALNELILESEDGTAVLHKLALNKEELDRINSLSPLKAAAEFGKIQAKLSNSSESTKQTEIKTSKAPAPISPVGSKASAATTKALNDPSISFAEYERERMKQLSKK